MLCVERVLLGSVGDEVGDPDGLPVDVGSGSVVEVVSVGSVGSLVGLTVVVTVPGGSGGALATTRLTVRPCLTLPAPGVCLTLYEVVGLSEQGQAWLKAFPGPGSGRS